MRITDLPQIHNARDKSITLKLFNWLQQTHTCSNLARKILEQCP